MRIRDPRELLDEIDQDLLRKYLENQPSECVDSRSSSRIQYSEPYGTNEQHESGAVEDIKSNAPRLPVNGDQESFSENLLKGEVMRLGDFIDTDAVSPPQPIQSLLKCGG